MIRCAIIEDELASVEILMDRIKKYYPELYIQTALREKKESVDFLNKHKIDLIFMDNHLIGGFGMQVLKEVDTQGLEVIFVTAYTEYAIEALNYGATYYLLKPYSDNQFKEAIDRALIRIHDRRRILMIGAKQDTMIQLDDVLFIQSEGVYSVFHLKDGQKVISSKNLGVYENRLSSYNFFRIHHSLIVNIDYVAHVQKGSQPMLVLKDGITYLPVSHRKAKYFFKAFGF